MYEDPDREKGYIADMDCTKAEVRRRFEENIRSMPGPDVANVWFWSKRCRSYSSWNIHNRGNRTFDNPLGDGSKESEVEGNDMSAWTAACLTEIYAQGKMALVEN